MERCSSVQRRWPWRGRSVSVSRRSEGSSATGKSRARSTSPRAGRSVSASPRWPGGSVSGTLATERPRSDVSQRSDGPVASASPVSQHSGDWFGRPQRCLKGDDARPVRESIGIALSQVYRGAHGVHARALEASGRISGGRQWLGRSVGGNLAQLARDSSRSPDCSETPSPVHEHSANAAFGSKRGTVGDSDVRECARPRPWQGRSVSARKCSWHRRPDLNSFALHEYRRT